MNVFGKFIDIQAALLNDTTTNSSWIQAIPVGKWKLGNTVLDFTKERLQGFADKINKNVRGIDLAVDYDHQIGIAAGWFNEAKVEDDGLYIKVDWTDGAAAKIRAGEYRYFSPEILFKWQHPVTKIDYTDVISGGAVTNKPFLKGIKPLELHDERKIMNRAQLEALAVKLGIKFDKEITDDDLADALAKFEPEDASNSDDDDVDEDEDEDDADVDEDDTDSDDPDGIAQLSESNPAVKALVQRLNEQDSMLKAIQATARRADVKLALAEFNTDQVLLSESATTRLGKFMVKLSESLGKEFKAIIQSFMDGSAVVQLGESSAANNSINLGGKSAFEVMEAEVTKLQEANKDMDYTTAMVQVTRENPSLFAEYQKEMNGV